MNYLFAHFISSFTTGDGIGGNIYGDDLVEFKTIECFCYF
jgi:hypothetical protein